MIRTSTLKPSTKPMKRKSRKQIAGHHDRRYLEACRGEQCFLQLPGCQSYEGDPTVVPAHSNASKHGKGMGIKAEDRYSVPACFYCHSQIDQYGYAGALGQAYFDRALMRWEGVRARKMGVRNEQA